MCAYPLVCILYIGTIHLQTLPIFDRHGKPSCHPATPCIGTMWPIWAFTNEAWSRNEANKNYDHLAFWFISKTKISPAGP